MTIDRTYIRARTDDPAAPAPGARRVRGWNGVEWIDIGWLMPEVDKTTLIEHVPARPGLHGLNAVGGNR